jgi:hypothetical protein
MSDLNNATSRKTPDDAPTVSEKPKMKIMETFSQQETKKNFARAAI